ncbi:spore cortex biosynthesis protein YabQ [Bacillus carboniphilus]|uniref:spore cortex biosynthesis protein YabQ n=1 Tax=Bacillus carboniphilus TaxID=86663 RepID=UPI0031CF498D
MTLTTQAYTLLAMIGMGSAFGAALDTYNRFLKRGMRKRWIVFVNDLLFWILQTLSIFYALFLVNHGELRFYLFLAILCGFAAYQSLFKRLYLRLLEKIILIVINLWKFLVKIFFQLIYNPIKAIIIFFISTIVFLGQGLFTLVKQVGKFLLWIIRVFLSPIFALFRFIWSKIPKRVTKSVEKFMDKSAGFYKKSKNTIQHLLKRLNKK